ncbi:Uncharacterised protein [Mycobacteroides abscessus subsp. abscessus]|nr:Uncharacterised protein [Mycobacteroides abscessus subsp. abscessus]
MLSALSATQRCELFTPLEQAFVAALTRMPESPGVDHVRPVTKRTLPCTVMW